MDWSGNLASLWPTAVRVAHQPGPPSRDGAPLFGEQTERAVSNFAVPGPKLSDFPDLVSSLALVKVAAAQANAELRVLEIEVADAIVMAAGQVLEGKHLDQFVVPMVQGGGGTSTHMNANEVIASLATQVLRERGLERTIHPNDHVNAGQSTNDVMPTAIALAVRAGADRLTQSLEHLVMSLQSKAAEYPDLEHLGRTCLRDAVALPVSAVHVTHAYGVAQASMAIQHAVDSLMSVPLGATAVGNGAGAAAGFADLAVANLARLSGYPLFCAEIPHYALASLEPLVSVSEALDRTARSIARVGADLRLLASGPVGGIGEVELPAVQAGSSIMPGKVNPVMPELMMQLSFQAAGDAASARAAAAAGELEVSAMGPIVTMGVLAGLERVGTSARLFAEQCIDGLRWNETAVKANLTGSLTEAVLAATTHGYEAVAERGGQIDSSRIGE